MSIRNVMLKYTNLAKNRSNKPTWAHTPSLCACVSLGKTDVSAYWVAMSGQQMLAYSSQNCNPGTNGEDGLGDIGGRCADLDTHFTVGRMGSVYRVFCFVLKKSYH
ncbi:hypothetical protein BTUL_0009g00170 [Botrytis tulipae]|uniref:Uncharacterized protein n=1 Tax=Botrytis tulipae TaxID=87230 RepID=A0A4Z1F4N3_9HELO|nr:hypothetical protein BTUL_0009g00170 [Botrytis tulipae]